MTKHKKRSTVLQRVEDARDQLLLEYIGYLHSLDEADASAWMRIVQVAREAGLDKETLCLELSCAWSTILRWEAGQTVPGPFARTAIKARLLQMLETMRVKQKALVAAE